MVDLPSTALLQPCMALEAGDGEGESQGTGKENLRGRGRRISEGYMPYWDRAREGENRDEEMDIGTVL
jgi:hypothetical protein